MVSAGSDGCNLCFRDNYCSKTTVTKLLHKMKKKDKCSLWGVSVALARLSGVFAHYVIFTYNIAMMYVHMH